jgi:hypothetical protein
VRSKRLEVSRVLDRVTAASEPMSGREATVLKTIRGHCGRDHVSGLDSGKRSCEARVALVCRSRRSALQTRRSGGRRNVKRHAEWSIRVLAGTV